MSRAASLRAHITRTGRLLEAANDAATRTVLQLRLADGIGAGGIKGFTIFAICYGPFYLYGAYDRANYSDKFHKDES